jgi:hypothetical protein
MKTINDGRTLWNLETPINPQRFVWHVSYRSLEKGFLATQGDFSMRKKIRKEGLIYREDWAVFAHNGLVKPEYIYPFCIDHFSFGETVNRVMKTMTNYDFWRIDTFELKNEWYVDPLMNCDIEKRYTKMNKHWFICTRQNIPPSALKLFTFKDAQIEEMGKIKVTEYDGAASVNFKDWKENLREHYDKKPTETLVDKTESLLAA